MSITKWLLGAIVIILGFIWWEAHLTTAKMYEIKLDTDVIHADLITIMGQTKTR